MKTLLKIFLSRMRTYLLASLESKLDKLIFLQGSAICANHTRFLKEQLTGGGGRAKLQNIVQSNTAQTQIKTHSSIDIRDFECSIYSQNGEDGIIDMLLTLLDSNNLLAPLESKEKNTRGFERAFVEFGVQDYTESNTRFVLKKRNFNGLIIDSSQSYINTIKRDSIYWKHDIEAKCSFIARENINAIIQEWLESRNLSNIALLSIDIDGMDYYVWEAITCIEPAIVVVEFNALLDPAQKLSVPYTADFDRFSAHHSGLYFGASLGAFIALGEKKGYDFIGADSSGTNAFFMRQSVLQALAPLDFKLDSLHQYCASHKARQSRDERGDLSYAGGDERKKLIAHLPLFEVQ